MSTLINLKDLILSNDYSENTITTYYGLTVALGKLKKLNIV